MNEDIIRMAREAGIRDCTCNGEFGCLERFAALVAAAEREACAKEAESWDGHLVAAEIRARGQPEKIKAVQEDDYCYGDERYYAND